MQQWVQQFECLPSIQGQIALPVATVADRHDNVFVTGYCLTTNDFPDTQYVTLKYSPSGSLVWTNYYNGPGRNGDAAAAMALDRAGNVFVTGVSGSDTNVGAFATIAYSNNGLPLWTNRYDNSQANISDDEAQAIAIDRSGAVYVSGCSWNGDSSYTTIKYSPGGVPVWTNLFHVPNLSTQAKALLAVGKSGTVFVAGIAPDESSIPSYVTLAYSSNGVPLWTNYYNGAYYAYRASAIAVDSHENVFVTGSSFNFPGEHGINSDWDTVAYSAAGIRIWTNRFDGPGHGDDAATAIAADDEGDVFVGGGAALFSDSGPCYATVAYSGSGIPLWTNLYTAMTNDDEIVAMAVDTAGHVFVTGNSVGNGTGSDYATIEYSRMGQSLSTNRYNGPLNDGAFATAITVGLSGDVYVTGEASDNNGPDFVTIKYSSAHFH